MTHTLLRRQAIELRIQGKSYNQIKQEIGVSKSTLSDWLRKYPLTRKQIHILKDINEVRIERYRNTMMHKREARLIQYYNEAKQSLLPLSKKELLIAGVFFYWGEGTKSGTQLVVANTDPSLVQFALLWMTQALEIPQEHIHILVHLYMDMNIEESLDYWSTLLSIPRMQFEKPYIKNSNRSNIDYKGYGHGTCNLRVYRTEIKERVMMAIKAVGDYSRNSLLKV